MSDKQHRLEGYRKILFIRPEEWPVHHYRLLGLATFEDDPQIIADAYDIQMEKARRHQLGPYGDVAEQVQSQLARARLCLLNPQEKAAYDQALHRRLDVAAPPAVTAETLAATQIPLAEPAEDDSTPRFVLRDEPPTVGISGARSGASRSHPAAVPAAEARLRNESERIRWLIWTAVPVGMVVLLACGVWLTSSSSATQEPPDTHEEPPSVVMWPILDRDAPVGEMVSFRVGVQSRERPEAFDYFVTSEPPDVGARITRDGEFQWTPPESLLRTTVWFNVGVSFEDGKPASEEFTIKVVAPEIPGPEITPVASQLVAAGEELRVRIRAQVPDTDDRVRFVLVDGPEGANLSSNGRFSWQTAAEDVDTTHVVIVSATTEAGGRSTVDFTIEVVEPSDTTFVRPPSRPEADHVARVGQSLVVPVLAKGLEREKIDAYRLRIPVSGAKFDDAGTLHWTPRERDAGRLIRFEVEMQYSGGFVEELIRVYVEPDDED